MNFVRNLTLRQLQIFVVAARHLSYARAAEELHLTPPAVSMQLKQLEDNVGLPLFDRLGRGVALTGAARDTTRWPASWSCSRASPPPTPRPRAPRS